MTVANRSGCSHSGRWPEVAKVTICLCGACSTSKHFLGESGPAGGLVRALHQVHGDVEPVSACASRFLQLRVEHGEDVDRRDERMQLVEKHVLLDEQVLAQLSLALGRRRVVVGVHVHLVRQRRLEVQDVRVRRRSVALERLHERRVQANLSS